MDIFNEFVDRFLQNNSTKQGYKDLSVKFLLHRCASSPTKLIPVSIPNDKDKTKPTEYLIKMAPSDLIYRRKKAYNELFHREWIIYTDCLPEYEKLEINKKVDIQYKFEAYPKFYAISLKPLEETFILENLEGSENFLIWDRTFSMDRNHIKLVLQEYAKFHAISFAVKKTQPALMNYIRQNTKEIFMKILQTTNELDCIEMLCDQILQTDDLKKNELYTMKLKYFKDNYLKIMMTCLENDNNQSRNVLLYGGNCSNDLLFRYKDPSTRDEPIEVKFVDWQKARYGSPMIDLVSFLYTSVSTFTLMDFENLLKYYYNCFLEHGGRLGLDLRTYYSNEEILEDWSKYSAFGFGLSILVLHKVILGKDIMPEEDSSLEEKGQLFRWHELKQEYFRRLFGNLKHCVERNLI